MFLFLADFERVDKKSEAVGDGEKYEACSVQGLEKLTSRQCDEKNGWKYRSD